MNRRATDSGDPNDDPIVKILLAITRIEAHEESTVAHLEKLNGRTGKVEDLASINGGKIKALKFGGMVGFGMLTLFIAAMAVWAQIWTG